VAWVAAEVQTAPPEALRGAVAGRREARRAAEGHLALGLQPALGRQGQSPREVAGPMPAEVQAASPEALRGAVAGHREARRAAEGHLALGLQPALGRHGQSPRELAGPMPVEVQAASPEALRGAVAGRREARPVAEAHLALGLQPALRRQRQLPREEVVGPMAARQGHDPPQVHPCGDPASPLTSPP